MEISMSDGTVIPPVTSAPASPPASALVADAAAPTQSQAQQDAATKNWYDDFGLAAENTQFLQEKKYTDLNVTLASAREADRIARSRNVLEKPAPDKILEWQGWEELGWKPKLEEYTLKPAKLENAPDELIGLVNDMGGLVRQVAHAARVPLPAAQMLVDKISEKFGDYNKKFDAQDAQIRQAGLEELSKEWGQDYARNEELARRAFQHYAKGDQAALAELIAIGSPKVMKIFAEIGKSIGEDTLVAAGGSPLPQSLDALDAQLKTFYTDPEKKRALQDPSHINHKATLAEYQAIGERKAKAELAARGK
jgi:hypothetical protein